MNIPGLWLLPLVLAAACAEDRERQIETPAGPEAAVAPPETAAPDKVVLAWTGCDISKKAYMLEAAAAYRRATGVEIVVTGGGATRGIRATAGGLADIGGSCRHCLPGLFPDEEKGAVLTHVAWDALVFFTHPGNQVGNLSEDQARGVLLGSVSNWKELGGDDARIIRSFRRQTVQGKLSGVGYMTRLMLFDDTQVDYTDDAIFHTSSGPLEEFVETTPYSFGVTGISSARKRNVKRLAFEGVAPTKENIASGAYRLFRPLYLVTKGEPRGPTRDFLDWILSDAGQAELSRAGTVNLAEGAALKAKFRHWPDDTGIIRNY